jgi:hypothetical protein
MGLAAILGPLIFLVPLLKHASVEHFDGDATKKSRDLAAARGYI